MAEPVEWSDLVAHLTGLAHVATASPDGRPHVAVVSPVVVGDTIWIATRASSGKASNVRANPRIALMFAPAAEAYVRGDVEIVDDAATKRAMWTGVWPFDLASFFGSPDNPDFVLLRVTPTTASVLVRDGSGITRRTWQR